MSRVRKTINSRFIGTFVNEMFAILLGIGMGSIVFSEGFSLTDPLGLASAVFVVVVVALYWWDWIDSVEQQVLSSRREFLIDLAMAFVFLMLFAFYGQPISLAAVFIALACLDLLWVANSCYECACLGKISPARITVAILRKLGAVAVFTGGYFVLRGFSDILPPFIQFAVVVVCFAVVRILFFSHIRRIRAVVLRTATAADVERIAEIHNSHVLRREDSLSGDGFLLSPTSEEDIQRKLNDPSRSILVAATIKNAVVGFVEVTERLPTGELATVSWRSEDVKEKFDGGDHCHVLCVAVAREYLGRGCGQMIYHRLRQRFPKATLSAFIATSPVENSGSLTFHLHQGFEEVGVFQKPELYGLKNYKSVLVADLSSKTGQ